MKKGLFLAGLALTVGTGCWVVNESNALTVHALLARQSAAKEPTAGASGNEDQPEAPRTFPFGKGQGTVLNTEDFAQFRRQVMPLIDQMAAKKIVSLGEGTHGTGDFYKVRYWITRILVEEKGFTHVAFENDYADSYRLDEGLRQGRSEYPALMKAHLLSIWQNREVAELLGWMGQYNRTAGQRVSFRGIDMVYTTNDALLLAQLLEPLRNAELNALTAKLLRLSIARDAIWNDSNRKDFKLDNDASNGNGVEGYHTVRRMEALLARVPLSGEKRRLAKDLLANARQQFEGFYAYAAKKPFSWPGGRDGCMADMALRIARKPEDKLIIWAHNAHVAKKAVFGGAVGGMGGYILEKRPGEYFVLGTGTAQGTFLATEEPFDTRTNPMKAYPLEQPLPGSWEEKLAATGVGAFYLPLPAAADTVRPHRHVGYKPDSGKNSYDRTNLGELYDAFLFIKDTRAARSLE